MLKKVLSVVLALVLAIGVVAVAASAATAIDLRTALSKLPSEYNATFYTDEAKAAILEARAAAENALVSGNAAEINAAYSLCDQASTIIKQKEERYIEEDDDYVDYYVNRDETKAVVDLDLKSNADGYLKAGDTVDVTISLDTNFYIMTMNIGFAYDKTKLEFVSESYPTDDSVKGLDLSSSAVDPNFTDGGNKAGSYPDSWTDEMKEQYNILWKMAGYDAYENSFFKPNGMTDILTITFRVKEDVEDGQALIFYSHDFQATFENYILGYYALPTLKFTRAYADTRDAMVADWRGTVRRADRIIDQQATVGQTVNFVTEQLVLNIGEAPAPADYTALDKAIADYANYNEADYTEESWAAYANAVAAGESCDRALTTADQGVVDSYTKAITDAAAALEYKQTENSKVLSVVAVSPIRLLQYVTLEVKVEDNPLKIQFVTSDNKTITLTRDHESVSSIVDNGDGTETWTASICVRKDVENYQVFAKYAKTGWSQPGYRYKLEVPGGIDTNVYSYEIEGAFKNALHSGVHKVTVTTGVDVTKVQFVRGSSTATYSASNATYEDVNGVRVWTINHNFGAYGEVSYSIRVRTAATAFETSDKVMDLVVVL